jgi:hypothetical protein
MVVDSVAADQLVSILATGGSVSVEPPKVVIEPGMVRYERWPDQVLLNWVEPKVVVVPMRWTCTEDGVLVL